MNMTILRRKLFFFVLAIITVSTAAFVISSAALQNSAEANRSCAHVPISKMRGFVYLDPVLTARENQTTINTDPQFVKDSLLYIARAGYTAIRVPFYWESYEPRQTLFMQRVHYVANIASQYGLCVIWDNHHYYTTSAWNMTNESGSAVASRGFPSFIVAGYPTTGVYDNVADDFWWAFYNNTITYNGASVWQLQFNFLATVFNAVKLYDSTKAFEILNEPHIWSQTWYDEMGNYHVWMAQQLRSLDPDAKVTIVVKRETMRGNESRCLSCLENNVIVPVKNALQGRNLAFSPHLYAVPFDGTWAEGQLQQFRNIADRQNIPVYIGEFAPKTQSEANATLSKYRLYDFGWTAFRWSNVPPGAGGLGAYYYIPNGQPTQYLQYLNNAYRAYYGSCVP